MFVLILTTRLARVNPHVKFAHVKLVEQVYTRVDPQSVLQRDLKRSD
jgi:hypothetical protein